MISIHFNVEVPSGSRGVAIGDVQTPERLHFQQENATRLLNGLQEVVWLTTEDGNRVALRCVLHSTHF